LGACGRSSARHEAPGSPLFSEGVKAGQHVYVAGMAGIDVKSGDVAGVTIQG
jgi:2-iminobutanoate/2-iminopropanoate deaminase